MIAFVVLAALALFGIAAAVRCIVLDGYRRVPTRRL